MALRMIPTVGLRSVRSALATLVVAVIVCALPTDAGATSVVAVGRAARIADHGIVRRAQILRTCQRRHHHCLRPLTALQFAGRRTSAADARLRAVVRTSLARVAHRYAAPRLHRVGTLLIWSRVAHARTYVLVRKARGEPASYHVVRRNALTPPSAPGHSVTYAVRAALHGARWSHLLSVAYPAATASAKPIDAPALRVAGRTLLWTRVAWVGDYVLAAKVAGRPTSYAVVHGTWKTPRAVPGKTVSFSVRTMVDGSAWAVTRKITYPGSSAGSAAAPPAPRPPAPSPPPSPVAAPPAGPSGPEFGIKAGSSAATELPFVKDLGARTVRIEYDIDTKASAIASEMDAWAKAGVRPLLLAGFPGRQPTDAEAANVATWAAAYGPGGTFWAGKHYPPSTAPVHIEFGSETSYSYQYPQLSGDPNWANTSFYAAMAQNYARRFKTAAVAVKAANPNVSLLAVGEQPGTWTSWMDSLFAAVPDLGSYVGGWTVHPYGPTWSFRVGNTLKLADAHGASSAIPLFVTEVGIATDGGRCLSDNYGWSACMGFDQAASTLATVVGGIRSAFGSRLGGLWLYADHDQKAPGTTNDREAYFGALTSQRKAKGAFTDAVKAVLAG